MGNNYQTYKITTLVYIMKILTETSISLFIISVYICLCGCSSNKKVSPPDNMADVDDKEILCTIADNLCEKADLKFIDTNTQKEYTSAWDAPENAELRFKNKYCNWHYTNGVLNIAMLHLADFVEEPKYVDFVRNHIAFGFDNYKYFQPRYQPEKHGKHWKYPLGELFNTLELDDFGAMISSALDLYMHPLGEKKMEYLDYAMEMGKFLKDKKLRTENGTFVRSFPQKNTLWGDDLYMSVPLLARLYQITGDETYLNDALNQIESFDQLLWDSQRGLYYHAYYTDLKRNGVAHWARCNGWLMFAKIELLKHTPENYPRRQMVIDLLNKQICGLARYQSPEGLWHQIIDRNDSYLESSASAMFTYSIASAVNNKWLDSRYASLAITAWEGLKKYMLTGNGDMKSICEGTEVHEDLQYYYTRPCGINEKHGLGALIEAGIEVMRLKQNYTDIVKDITIRVNLNNEES